MPDLLTNTELVRGVVVSLLLSVPILASLAWSMGHNSFQPLIISVFLAIICVVMFLRPHLIVVYFLLLGYFFFPGSWGRIGDLVTLNWARIVLLTFLLGLQILVSLRHQRFTSRMTAANWYLLTSAPWILYIGLSITWALSPIDALRYYPKLLFCLVIGIAVLISDRISATQAVRFLLLGGLLFAIGSTPYEGIRWNTTDVAWFIGIFGRHTPKFPLTFIVLLSIAAMQARIRPKMALFTLVLSFIWLMLLLQRGAMLALAIAGITYWILSMDKIRIGRILQGAAMLAFVAGIGWTLFYNSSFASYMFIPNRGPDDLILSLRSGDLLGAIDLVNFKGRLELWEYALQLGIGVFGAGMGSTSFFMNGIFGRVYEIHNDHLTYLIDGGYIGYGLFMLMWIGMIALALRYRQSRDRLTRMLALLVGSYSAALFFWGIVDHVVSYADASFAYLYILAALLAKRQQELEKHA